MNVVQRLTRVLRELPEGVELVAVSKTHPAETVLEAYDAGQRIFGENRPQEMAAKRAAVAELLAARGLPDETRWHQIGHLQTNKVKLIAPFVEMIHSLDSARLAREITRQAAACGRVIDVLLEIRIAREATKEGWEFGELVEWLSSGEFRELAVDVAAGRPFGVRFCGVMGVATFSDDADLIRSEFCALAEYFGALRDRFFGPDYNAGPSFDTLSAGMSSDYTIAISVGSTLPRTRTLVRIGSLIFGERM